MKKALKNNAFNLLKKVLKKYGFELKPIDETRIYLEEAYRRGGEQFSFIQIGANDGVKFDGLYDFVTTHNSEGLVVEPVTYYFNKLSQNYQSFPNIKAVQCAVHAEEESIDLHYVDPERMDSLPDWAEGIGSIDSEHHKNSGIPSDCIISEKVDCRTLMDIVKEANFATLQLLQIDVEGYDAEVLKMIDFSRVKPQLIKFEHQSLSAVDQKAITQLLEGENYELLKQRSDTVARLRA